MGSLKLWNEIDVLSLGTVSQVQVGRLGNHYLAVVRRFYGRPTMTNNKSDGDKYGGKGMQVTAPPTHNSHKLCRIARVINTNKIRSCETKACVASKVVMDVGFHWCILRQFRVTSVEKNRPVQASSSGDQRKAINPDY